MVLLAVPAVMGYAWDAEGGFAEAWLRAFVSADVGGLVDLRGLRGRCVSCRWVLGLLCGGLARGRWCWAENRLGRGDRSRFCACGCSRLWDVRGSSQILLHELAGTCGSVHLLLSFSRCD